MSLCVYGSAMSMHMFTITSMMMNMIKFIVSAHREVMRFYLVKHCALNKWVVVVIVIDVVLNTSSTSTRHNYLAITP